MGDLPVSVQLVLGCIPTLDVRDLIAIACKCITRCSKITGRPVYELLAMMAMAIKEVDSDVVMGDEEDAD